MYKKEHHDCEMFTFVFSLSRISFVEKPVSNETQRDQLHKAT